MRATHGQRGAHVAVCGGLAQLAVAQPPVHGHAGEEGVALLAGDRLPTHRRRRVHAECGGMGCSSVICCTSVDNSNVPNIVAGKSRPGPAVAPRSPLGACE